MQKLDYSEGRGQLHRACRKHNKEHQKPNCPNWTDTEEKDLGGFSTQEEGDETRINDWLFW